MQSVFMEVQRVCGHRLNVDDAPSASAPHPEGTGGSNSISPLDMTATTPEYCLKAKNAPVIHHSGNVFLKRKNFFFYYR